MKWIARCFTLYVGINALFLLYLVVSPSFLTIRRIYNFNTVILPTLLLAAGCVGFAKWNRRPFDTRTLRISCVSVLFAMGAYGVRLYATHIEPGHLQVRRVSIQTKKVAHPLRILHVSDIQIESVGSYENTVFQRIRDLHPDVVLFTGDMLQTRSPEIFEAELPKLANLFRTLTPHLGIYGVRGDTDWRIESLSSEELGNIHMLSNTEAVVEAGDTRLSLFGIPCQASRGRTNAMGAVEAWFEKTEPSDFTILLGHAPDYVMSAKDMPIDLCLAGHTHGGQIRFPLFGPIITLSSVPRSWARGFRNVGRTHLNVSAGVGCEHKDGVPPIRFLCPPEMTLITLLPDRKEEHPISNKEYPRTKERTRSANNR